MYKKTSATDNAMADLAADFVFRITHSFAMTEI